MVRWFLKIQKSSFISKALVRRNIQGLKISPALRRLFAFAVCDENSNVWKRLDSRTQDAVRDLIH